MQRAFDIVFSGVAILLLSPLLVPLAVILKLSGEGEIFYHQTRVGKNGRPFQLKKFATMLKDSPNIGAGEITLRNDPRILPLGHLLRKTKLNELPQLLNIFFGEMSIVGPRPMVPSTFEKYPDEAKRVICSVRPGLTGIGSIVFRDEEKYLDGLKDPQAFYRDEIIPYKARLECWFVDQESICLYFKIILVTAWVVLFPQTTLVNQLFNNLPTAPDSLRLELE